MEKMVEIIETINTSKYYNLKTEDDIIKNVSKKINNKFYKNNDNLIFTENIENRILKKIYEKFNIERLDENNPVDLVCTFINHNDKEYFFRQKKIKNKEYLKNLEIDCKEFEILEKYINEKNNFFYDFFINLEITRKNLPFLRNIFIISPTPAILYDTYINDNKVIIINTDDLLKKYNNINKFIFRPNNLIYFLKDIKNLSNIFLYGPGNCIISKTFKKSFIFSNNKVNTFLERKKFKDENIENLKDLEEYNANKLFTKKYLNKKNYCCLNQYNFVRKDTLKLMAKIFKYDSGVIDYLLLQFLLGEYFELYSKVKVNSHSGLYKYNIKNPFERFNKIINKENIFFCVNYLNKKLIPYYLHSIFLSNDIYNKNKKKIYVVNKLKYIVPYIEKIVKSDIEIVNNIKKDFGNIGKDVLISNKKMEVNTILIKIEEGKIEKVMSDIIFFSCINFELKNEDYSKFKEGTKMIEIFFPEKFLLKMEKKDNIPYSRFLENTIIENSNGIKNCNLLFNSKEMIKN